MNLDSDGYDSDDCGYDKRSWATPPQWHWLKRWRPAYLAAQKEGKLGKYLNTLARDFFEEWSECKVLFGHTNKENLTPEQLEQLAEAVKQRRHVRIVTQLLTCHVTDIPFPSSGSNSVSGTKTAIVSGQLPGDCRACSPLQVCVRRLVDCRRQLNCSPSATTNRR